MNFSDRAGNAKHTLQILDQGRYTNSKGETIKIKDALDQAIDNTSLHRPDDFELLFKKLEDKPLMAYQKHPEINVTAETTLQCAFRLITQQKTENVCLLNFASAKNPGGGFLGNAQAQEESLARASGLFYCINPQQEMYQTNRNSRTLLYTDYMIYSPAVPVIKNDKGVLHDNFYTVDMLTAPAVNKGALQNNEPQSLPRLHETMLSRTEKLLALAAHHGATTLILGAWGCGVFKNDPLDVAGYFKRHLLENKRFENRFDRVVFAIPGASDDRASMAFRRVFGV